MTQSTQLAVVPQGLALPAYLQTPDIAAQIAADNAAAAGGIRTGGFPRISIKGAKFHLKDGGETNTFMNAPTSPGQPALPMMCFEAVIIAANPALTKTYYPGDYKDGDDSEPTCQSSNGIAPDSHVQAKQSALCATCPQAQWGSKISKASGKEVKACSDSKRLVVLPAWFEGGLEFKALALDITPSALTEWGKYVKALSERNIPISSVVTNLTFDATASHPKLLFAYNRFLTADQYAKVQERAKGDDVKNIISPSHPVVVQQLAAPAPVAAIAPPVTIAPIPLAGVAAPAFVVPQVGGVVIPPAAPAPTYAPPSSVPATVGAVPTEEPPKRTRKPRTPAAPTGSIDLSYLPPGVAQAIAAVGADSPAGQALLAQFPAPQAQAPSAPPPVTPPPPAAGPVFSTSATPASVGAVGMPPAAPPGPVTQPTAQVISSGASLKDILAKKLGLQPTA